MTINQEEDKMSFLKENSRRKQGKHLLAYFLVICMLFSCFMSMPSAAYAETDANAWQQNGLGLNGLTPENVVVFAGKTMDKSKMGFLKNYYYLTEDELNDLRVNDNGTRAYSYFGEEAWLSNCLYSSSDDHGVQEWRYNCLTGIDLKKAFTGLGVETSPAMSVRVKSTDGMSYVLSNAFDESRYYFNPKGEKSATPVAPILALKRTTISTLIAPASDSTLEAPTTAADTYQPLFAYGQQTVNECNNCSFVKTVNSVVAGTEDVALTVKRNGKSDMMMSISEIIRQGVYKADYHFYSSGSADIRTHKLTGIPLTKLLNAMGASVESGQSVQPANSDGYQVSAIPAADVGKWFVAYDAREDGSQVSNNTALRLYGPGQFGNQMIVKHLTTLTVTGEAAQTGGKKQIGGDAENAVFYIAVKENANSETKYYYYTREELEAIKTDESFTFNNHGRIMTVTARGALLKDLLDNLDGATITDNMIVQYAEADGYHANQNTAIENSKYKDKVAWLTQPHFNGSITVAPAKTIISYGINEKYKNPDENNVNDPEGVFKDADNNSGYLRAYRETGSGQDDANIGGANATVIKYLMGVVVSYDGAQFSGKDGYTLKAVSDKNPDLSIIADQKVTGLMPGMQFAVKAPSVVNSVLAAGEPAHRTITVEEGATQTVTFKYTEQPYFYVTKGGITNYTYTDLVKVSVQLPDKDANTAPYGYSRPMYYRYNGVWLADLIGAEIMNDISVTGFNIIAKDGSKTAISKEDVTKYFVAYNNTQSKASTNIPEGKRVTKTYQDAKIIIPDEGVNITGSAANDYTSAGKDVGVLVAEAEGIVADTETGGGGSGGGEVAAPTVRGIALKDAPSKVEYNQGDALDLTGLKVTLTYADGSKRDVAYADFANYGISVKPNNGAILGANDQKIVVTVSGKTIELAITVNPVAGAKKPNLKDIDGHWAEETINDMVEKGIVNGYPDDTFKPEQTVTRAEFTVMLARAFGLQPGEGKTFEDTANHWAQSLISAARDAGIVSGSSDQQFDPDVPITREQMAVMIVKAIKADASGGALTFKDKDSISAWARQSVASAVANELMFGYPDQTFRPLDNASRAEAVSVIARALQKKQ
jgi:hypothetical protein